MGQFFIDYLPLVVFIAMIVAVGLWHALEFRLKPLAIPKAQINAIVDDLIAKHGSDAEDWARGYEEEAWNRSETFEQGKWRRVRRELWRRYEAGEWE